MRDLTIRKAALRAELEQMLVAFYGAGGKVRHERGIPVACTCCAARRSISTEYFNNKGLPDCIRCGAKMRIA
jgi:hypothetical protein